MPFTYPTSAEFRRIEPELIQLGDAGRLGLELFPTRSVDAAKVRWSQEDSFYGLQNFRGMDGQPTRVVRVGENTYEYEPGVFGEFGEITETELTNRSVNLDVASTPIPVDDLILGIDKHLIGREGDRKESSVWSLLLDGVLNITMDGPNGLQQVYKDEYPIQTYTAPVSWSDLDNATPIRNLQTLQQLPAQQGISADFGSGATLVINSVTANNLINNQNAADVSGKRIGGGNTVNDLNSIISILQAINLPRIRVYDRGYLTAPPSKGGKFKKFIPDNRGVLIGQRPGNARLGEYLLTRNASNGYRPGSYAYTIDRANGVNGEKRTPANIERHRGHNGGPVIYYPSAIVSVNL